MAYVPDHRATQASIDNGREDARLRVPSTWTSAGMEFAESATAVPRLAYDVTRAMQGLPFKSTVDDQFDIFHKAMETPNEGWGQETVDFFAGAIGYLNPVNDLAIVKPLAKGVEKVAGAISQRLPSAATAIARTPIRQFGGRVAEVLPKTIGGAGKDLAKTMAVASGITAPQAFIDSYNEKTNTFDIMGAVKQTMMNGVIGLGLHAIPVVGGILFGKHKRLFGKAYKNPMPGDSSRMGEFDKAFENNEISTEAHDWIKTYLENPDDIKSLTEKGVQIALKEGYPINRATGEVAMKLVKKEHYDDFNTGMLDQIASGASGEFSTSVSDYVAASGMDYLKSQNEKLLDGLNGHVEFMEKRLAAEDENMKRFSKIRKDTDLAHIDEKHPLAQKGVHEELKNAGYDLQRLPHAIPENLRYRASQERKITRLKEQIGRYKKLLKKDPKYNEAIDNASAELRDVMANREKLLTPNQELKKLEGKFLAKKPLPEDYRDSHDYQRLVDLSHVSKKADALLHHIHLKDEYETQTHYNDLIKFLNGVVGSSVKKFADPTKVVNYMKAQYASLGPRAEEMMHPGTARTTKQVPIEDARHAMSDRGPKDEINDLQRDAKENVRNDEQVLQDADTDITQAGAEPYEEEYKFNTARYNQFKDHQRDLADLVACDRGTKAPEVAQQIEGSE